MIWGRQSYRWSDLDFDANAKDGIASDWLIRYKDFAPWYDHVLKFGGIKGSMEGLAHLIDGHFLSPMDLNIVEKDGSARFKQQFKNRHMVIGSTVNLTAPIRVRIYCQYSNHC